MKNQVTQMQVKISAATARCRFILSKICASKGKAKQTSKKPDIRLLSANVRNRNKQGIDNKISADCLKAHG